MSNGDPYLFVGGPAHGRWIVVEKGRESVRVAAPVPVASWLEDSDPYVMPVDHVYAVEDLAIFGHHARVMICRCCCPTFKDMGQPLMDLLLSDDGKAVLRG